MVLKLLTRRAFVLDRFIREGRINFMDENIHRGGKRQLKFIRNALVYSRMEQWNIIGIIWLFIFGFGNICSAVSDRFPFKLTFRNRTNRPKFIVEIEANLLI